MIRIKISFVKRSVMPLLQQYRPDLYNFCNERKHPFDFARELLNIYFQKPTNRMKFGGLDIQPTTLTFLEPLKYEFEILYAEPQRRKAIESTPSEQPGRAYPNGEQSGRSSYEPTIPSTNSGVQGQVHPGPFTPNTPPPPPIWNQATGRWDTAQPVAQTPPPPPVWNGQEWVMATPPPPVPVYVEPEYEEEEKEIVEEHEIIEEHVDPAPMTVKMKNVEFDPRMFIPLQTGTKIDDFVSFTHGIMPATNIMLQGPAGSGKSSLLIDIACKIKANDPEKRVLFISGEMTKIDMKGLVDRFDGFEDLDILFLNEYADTDTRELLNTILATGWDLVIVDSFSEVLGSIIDTAEGAVNTKSGEKWLINQFLKHNEGGNELGLPTAFFFILQVGKDGTFVGSNRIKHAATAFMQIEFTKSSNLFMTFSKNRRGETYNKMYFEHYVNGIHYDFDRYDYDIQLKETLKQAEMTNKSEWKTILKANVEGDDTSITGENDEREESLLGAIETYDQSKEIRDRRLAEATASKEAFDAKQDENQIDLEDMIEEAEKEDLHEEPVDEVIEMDVVATIEEPIAEVTPKEIEEVREVEEVVNTNIQEAELAEKDLENEGKVNIPDLIVDELPTKVEEKDIPKDNPNALDSIGIIEL